MAKKPSLILVVGQTGVGKSQFVNVALGQPPPEDIGMTSETKPPEEHRCQGGIGLVDTPGFDPTYSSPDPMHSILLWMEEQKPDTQFLGMLYLVHKGQTSFPELEQFQGCKKIGPDRLMLVGTQGATPEIYDVIQHGFKNTQQSALDIINDLRKKCEHLPAVYIKEVRDELVSKMEISASPIPVGRKGVQIRAYYSRLFTR